MSAVWHNILVWNFFTGQKVTTQTYLHSRSVKSATHKASTELTLYHKIKPLSRHEPSIDMPLFIAWFLVWVQVWFYAYHKTKPIVGDATVYLEKAAETWKNSHASFSSSDGPSCSPRKIRKKICLIFSQ